MTTPGDPRTGRKWQALSQAIIRRDKAVCWRCGHEGADTAGHVLPWIRYPHLGLDPDNLRAEHGTKRTLEVDGFDCRGNYSHGADAGQGMSSTVDSQRRRWVD